MHVLNELGVQKIILELQMKIIISGDNLYVLFVVL